MYDDCGLSVRLTRNSLVYDVVNEYTLWLVLCLRGQLGDRKLALWLCHRIFPMCYQFSNFTHTVYE